MIHFHLSNISILGDSITKGIVWDINTQKYKILPNNAVNLFCRQNNVLVHNYSHFGYTSHKALRMLDTYLQSNSDDYVLVELGGNDCDFNWEALFDNPKAEVVPHVTIEEYKNNIWNIFNRLYKFNKRVIIMTLPPIDAEKYLNWVSKANQKWRNNILKFIKEPSFLYRHHEFYARTFEQTALQNGVRCLPIRDEFLTIKDYGKYLCEDGIHPNILGHQIIFNVFNKIYMSGK
jgi:lysophospholipase L1-like esterase